MPGKFIAVICDAEHSQVCSINDFLDQNLRTEEIVHVRHAQATESWSVESKYADSISGEDIAMFLKERLDVASFAVFDFDMYKERIETCWVSPGGEEELPWLRSCAFEYFQSPRHGFYYL